MKLMGKEFNMVAWFVGLSFLSLFVFFLSEGYEMPRGKKKMNYTELEEHVTNWALDQIEKLRTIVDELEDTDHISDNDKIIVFGEVAQQLKNIVILMKKINHDERTIFNWVEDFIANNQTFNMEN